MDIALQIALLSKRFAPYIVNQQWIPREDGDDIGCYMFWFANNMTLDVDEECDICIFCPDKYLENKSRKYELTLDEFEAILKKTNNTK